MSYTEITSQAEIRKNLIKKYTQVRLQTLHLCKPLKTEDYVVQPTMDVSPPKWHLAHTTWFFEAFILNNYAKNYKELDERYGYLFNSYYVTVGDRWSRAQRGHLSRPTVEEIFRYREYVDENMLDLLNGMDQFSDEFLHVLEVGFQHEQQHQELFLYDIKWILGENPMFPAYNTELNKSSNNSVKRQWLEFESGQYDIGYNGTGFSFDNERERHTVYLKAFQVASHTCTNEEYLEFMEAGGYKDTMLWMMEGMDWVMENQINSPKYWNFLDGEWYEYTLGGLKKLDMNAPVSHISFYEADAFAKWKGMRLPTEAEWEIAAVHTEPKVSDYSNFVEDERLHPIYNRHTHFLGNQWEWTESSYRPYPNFKPDNGSLGEYNGKFMINQMVLRGGSYATPKNHIRHTYRNFFHPHLQWMVSGLRLAKYI